MTELAGVPVSDVIEAGTRSVTLGLGVAAASGSLGVAMAWLTARTDLPGRRYLETLLSVPYALPPYLLAMAWVVLGNPTVGLLKAMFPSGGIYGLGGMIWVLTTVAFAFPYLELKAAYGRLDPALEEAARMSGAGPGRVFLQIALPLLWPSLLNGMCLAFLYSLAAFGVP
ncbi:MAG TPA: ABC transporter permease subunit, partial [Bdellovibrionota bacterium]|nr:ABC transporter permease subunit [Bdellovibrionota bacterium]